MLWKLRSEEPQTVAELLTDHGVNDYELALDEVERLRSRRRPQLDGPGPAAQDAAEAFEGCLFLGGAVGGVVQTVVLFLVVILLLYLLLNLVLLLRPLALQDEILPAHAPPPRISRASSGLARGRLGRAPGPMHAERRKQRRQPVEQLKRGRAASRYTGDALNSVLSERWTPQTRVAGTFMTSALCNASHFPAYL